MIDYLRMSVDERLELPIATLGNLGVPNRSISALEGAKIETIGQLLQHRKSALMKQVPNFGPESLTKVQAALKKIGFSRHQNVGH